MTAADVPEILVVCTHNAGRSVAARGAPTSSSRWAAATPAPCTPARYPGKRYLDWELTDPAGKPVEDVRPIVDDIERRAVALLDGLLGDR